MPFTCIYCHQSHPEVMPSEAHIIPHVIGGVTSTTHTVCKACNHTVNREVERPALHAFDFFRNVWGIEGRRGSVPRLPATLVVNRHRGPVTLDEHGQPTHPIVSTEPDATGRKTYVVAGPSEAAEAKRQEIAQKYP